MKKAIVVLVMLVAMNASGQWVQLSNWNGANNTIYSITGDSNYLFVGTYEDGLYRSTNAGETFTKTSLNEYRISSIAVSGNNVFAGTVFGLYLSTDKGNSWSLNSFNNLAILKIFIQGNYIYAATDSYNPYKVYFSSNNGVNWVQTNLSTQKITSFTYDGCYIYAASKYTLIKPPIYRSTLGDTSWTLIAYVDSLSPDSRQSVGDLISIGNYIFAGMTNFQMYTRSVYQSSNYGVNWIPTSLDEGDVFTLSTTGNNLVAGMYGRGVYLSTNYGENWISKNQGIGNNEYISYSSKTNNYIFVGSSQHIWRRTLAEIVSVQNISTEVPSSYSLSQNYPNPFNPTTLIRINVGKTENGKQKTVVKLVVYDVAGKEVARLVNKELQPGTYEVTFDGSRLNSGVYFYRLTTETFNETKRMVLIK
jgi:hypothetical protein